MSENIFDSNKPPRKLGDKVWEGKEADVIIAGEWSINVIKVYKEKYEGILKEKRDCYKVIKSLFKKEWQKWEKWKSWLSNVIPNTHYFKRKDWKLIWVQKYLNWYKPLSSENINTDNIEKIKIIMNIILELSEQNISLDLFWEKWHDRFWEGWVNEPFYLENILINNEWDVKIADISISDLDNEVEMLNKYNYDWIINSFENKEAIT